jgi:hypothetical protein
MRANSFVFLAPMHIASNIIMNLQILHLYEIVEVYVSHLRFQRITHMWLIAHYVVLNVTLTLALKSRLLWSISEMIFITIDVCDKGFLWFSSLKGFFWFSSLKLFIS